MTDISLITRLSRKNLWTHTCSPWRKPNDWTGLEIGRARVGLVPRFFAGFIIALFPLSFAGCVGAPSAPLAVPSVTGTDSEKHSVRSKSVTC